MNENDKYISALKLNPRSPYARIVKKGKSFLGIGGKHIYTVSMAANKVFGDDGSGDQYQDTLVRSIIKRARTKDSSIYDFLADISRVGTYQFDKFRSAADLFYTKHNTNNHKSAVRVLSDGVLRETVNDLLIKVFGKGTILDSYSFTVLEPLEWCRYQLQELYDYTVRDDVLVENDIPYSVSSVEYNSTKKQYKCTLKSINTLHKRVEQIEEVEVISGSSKDTVTTTVLKKTTFVKPNTNYTVSENLETISTSTKEVSKGSVEPSVTTTVLSTGTSAVENKTTTKYIAPYDTIQQYFLITYLEKDTYTFKYWVYNPNDGTYPELNDVDDVTLLPTMYPAVIIKDDFNYVKDTEREATAQTLASLGLDLDYLIQCLDENENSSKVMDSFFVIGVSPSDESDTAVSKALYETVDYVYDNAGLVPDTTYSMMFNQDMYNSNIIWTSTSPLVKTQKIGNVNDCVHTSAYTNIYNNFYVICNATNKRNATSRSYYADVTVRYIWERTLHTGALVSRTVYDTKVLKNVYFYGKANDYYEGNSEDEVPVITAGYDGKCIVRFVYMVDDGYIDDEHVATPTYAVIPLHVQLTFDGSDCYSESHLREVEQATAMTVTKQITATTTRTHTLLNFIGNFTIKHPQGVSVIGLNGKNEELVIPLFPEVMQRLSIFDKCKLLDNAIYLQHYAFDHQYVKWYKTGAFAILLKIIMIIIIIVITVMTAGQGTAPAAKITAVLWALLEAVVISVALTLALKLVAKYTSGWLQAVLSAVVIVAMMVMTGGFSDFGLVEACTLIDSCVSAFNIYLGEQMSALQQKFANLTNAAEERLEEFTEAEKLLDVGLSVTDIVDITINASNYEFPSARFNYDSFYYMTFDAYKDNDLLYSMPRTSVDEFVDRQLALI